MAAKKPKKQDLVNQALFACVRGIVQRIAQGGFVDDNTLCGLLADAEVACGLPSSEAVEGDEAE